MRVQTAALLAVLCPAVPVTAAQTGLGAPEVMVAAERARAAGEPANAIALYDALARDPDPDVPAEARFRKGLMLAAAKRYAEAATSFRACSTRSPAPRECASSLPASSR